MPIYLKLIIFFYQLTSFLIWIIIASWSAYHYMNLQGKKLMKENTILLNADVEKFLPSLGLKGENILYPDAYHAAVDLPIFILALRVTDDMRHVHRFLGNFRIHMGNKKLIIYDLGIKREDIFLIRSTCQCLVRSTHLHKYPPHVQNLQTNAYRSILIQETLQEFGIVFWCNVRMRFLPSSRNLIPSLIERSKNLGIQAWPSQPLPTSALTHRSTLLYLNAPNRTVFNFVKMVEPDAAIYCNTYRLHAGLMLHWVRCALTEACIAPEGAGTLGDSGSGLEHCSKKKPMYKYTGCHRYDSSIFNVILGHMFHYDSLYIPKERIFRWEINLPQVSTEKEFFKQSSLSTNQMKSKSAFTNSNTDNNYIRATN